MEKVPKFWHGGKRKGIDFSANLNPYPLPDRIKRFYTTLWEEVQFYPDPFSESLRNALSKHLGGEKENYLVSNGSSELFFLLFWVFRPQRVIIPYPTYVEYERVARIFGRRIYHLRLSTPQFILPSSLPPSQGRELFFLCHPNNPTGNFLIPSPSLPEMQGRIWVIDETYIELTSRDREMSFLSQARERKDLIVIRSFTKTYSLPGLRLGYLVAHSSIVSQLYSQTISWSVNAIAQRIGEEVLKEGNYREEIKKKIVREREFLFRELKKTRFYQPYPSETNFLMVRLPSGKGRKLREYLERKEIYIRFLSDVRGLGEDYIRIGLRTRKDNQTLLTHLKEFLSTIGKR